ncbi:MAG: hypothetical protein OEY79_02090 [Anaplasmataceae bacterium]|nr:hypothetical protein [Anaplasmataceae bacterium]
MKYKFLPLFLYFILSINGIAYANEYHNDNSGGIGILINAGGSWYWPINSNKMKLTVDGMKISSNMYSSDGKLVEIEDQYTYGFNGAIYTPLLFDGLLGFGGSFNWIVSQPKDEFKTLYTFGNTKTSNSSPNKATTTDDRIAKISYDGFNALSANAEALFMISGIGGSDFNIYIPLSAGITWAGNSDFYYKKSQNNVKFDSKKALNFSGGLGFLYSISESSGVQVDVRYYSIMDLQIPYNKHIDMSTAEIEIFTDLSGRKAAAKKFDEEENARRQAAAAAGVIPTPSATEALEVSNAVSMSETSTKKSYLSINPSYIVFNIKFGITF